ncbi:MAG: amino acid carrier protein, partial [Oscillospiraceae bacterium]|nr:amino acid carrier protein [Oscillospiraceae bacterium]
ARRGGIRPVQCLCTALATTVGTGNIAGTAVALTTGGPGALVWMWISAAVGCAVKYAECALAVTSRRGLEGKVLGGPMLTLSRLSRPMGQVYALLMVGYTLSAGPLAQSSAIASAARELAAVPPLWTGLILAGALLAVLSGGVGAVARLSTLLVPLMCGLYLLGGAAVLWNHPGQIAPALAALLRSAFDLRSAGAGAFGHMVRVGVTRGCFSNDAGTGSAAFSAAQTSASPRHQGLVSASANLWDTGVICTVTALSILVSGSLDSGLTGVALTMAAYRAGLGRWGPPLVGVCLILFAFSTLPGLAFQGEQALAWLLGSWSGSRAYRVIFSSVAAVGCLFPAQSALAGADLFNGLLVLVNIPSLWLLPIPGKNENNPCNRAHSVIR